MEGDRFFHDGAAVRGQSDWRAAVAVQRKESTDAAAAARARSLSSRWAHARTRSRSRGSVAGNGVGALVRGPASERSGCGGRAFPRRSGVGPRRRRRRGTAGGRRLGWDDSPPPARVTMADRQWAGDAVGSAHVVTASFTGPVRLVAPRRAVRHLSVGSLRGRPSNVACRPCARPVVRRVSSLYTVRRRVVFFSSRNICLRYDFFVFRFFFTHLIIYSPFVSAYARAFGFPRPHDKRYARLIPCSII